MRSSQYRLPPFDVRAKFVSLSETVDWGLALLRVPDAWRHSQGAGIRVAILDTGIDEAHPDLMDAVEHARDFTGSRRGAIDGNGHGTHVAGIVAARRNEDGVVGVAPECRLIVAKVLGDDGSGDDRQVAAGIAWAVESGADILSLSLGSSRPSKVLLEAIRFAAGKGRFVICAAGNSGAGGRGTRVQGQGSSVTGRTHTCGPRRPTCSGPRPSTLDHRPFGLFPRASTVDYPARWPETVAVAAIGRDGQVARFSSRGGEVDIAAPGEDVLSTWLGGAYARLSGTSMATPFVSGVVALTLAKHRKEGGRTPIHGIDQLLEHLRRTATDAGPAGHDPAFGWGLIDPGSLLAGDGPPVSTDDGVWVWIPGGKVGSEGVTR
jgi:subtilisin family serine protease